MEYLLQLVLLQSMEYTKSRDCGKQGRSRRKGKKKSPINYSTGCPYCSYQKFAYGDLRA